MLGPKMNQIEKLDLPEIDLPVGGAFASAMWIGSHCT